MRSFYVAATVVAVATTAQKLTAPPTATAAAAESRASSEKMLRVEVTVPAPKAEVWKAFATSEGLSSWLAPNSVV
ncbi:MAG: hypothetical protein JWO39_1573, partial [Gemmatimonadetes bacterium]|nr:hypothetical protein [Gemmatimonadota bacterium]